MNELLTILPAIVLAFALMRAARRSLTPWVWFGLLAVWIVSQAVLGMRAGLTAGVVSLLIVLTYLIVRAKRDPRTTLVDRR